LSPVDLLAELARIGATVSIAESGKIHVEPGHGGAALKHACRRWKWVLSWGLHGAERGYRWFACDTCGSLSPLAREPGKTCTMELGCKGRWKEIPLPRFAPGAPHAVREPESAVR